MLFMYFEADFKTLEPGFLQLPSISLATNMIWETAPTNHLVSKMHQTHCPGWVALVSAYVDSRAPSVPSGRAGSNPAPGRQPSSAWHSQSSI